MTRTITLNERDFVLGKKYKDTVLGIEGVATGGAQHLTGCDQVCLSRLAPDSGETLQSWLDVTRIEGIETEERPGGPAPTPGERATPGGRSGPSGH